MMSNLFDLSGRNAMIFGGAGGLGKLIAKAYAERAPMWRSLPAARKS